MKYIKLYDNYDVDKIRKHYKGYSSTFGIYNKHKKDNKRMGWITKEGQYKRFKIMSKYVKDGDSVLDYGSGLGNLFDYFNSINKDVNYMGVDIDKKFIDESIGRYGGHFYQIGNYRNVVNNFDWFLASGTFNVYTSTKTFYETIDYFYNKVNKGLSFNLLNDGDSYNSEPTFTSDRRQIRAYNMSETYTYFKKLYGKVRVVPFATSKIRNEYNIYILK